MLGDAFRFYCLLFFFGSYLCYRRSVVVAQMDAIAHHSGVKGHVCCCVGNEIWTAVKGCGEVTLHTPSGEFIQTIAAPSPADEDAYRDDAPSSRVMTKLLVVLTHVWASTVNGDILVFNAIERRAECRIPLSKKFSYRNSKMPALTDMCFDGSHVYAASEAGRVLVISPTEKIIVKEMTLEHPCTSIGYTDRYLLVGDRQGGIHVIHKESARRASVCQNSKAAVRCLLVTPHHLPLHPSKRRVWVGCEDGMLYGYALRGGKLALKHLVDGVGTVANLTEFSGLLVASTVERYLAVLEEETGRLVCHSTEPTPSFISDVVKVRSREEAHFWLVSLEGDVLEWRMEGLPVAPSGRPLSYRNAISAAAADATETGTASWRGSLIGVSVQEERLNTVKAKEAMRSVEGEARELRMMLITHREEIDSREAEIADRKERESRLLEENAKLKEELVPLKSSLDVNQKEVSVLQSQLLAARDELSTNKVECSQSVSDKFTLQAELFALRTSKSYTEQQLQDAQNIATGLRAENARLCKSIESFSLPQEQEKARQQHSAEITAEATTALMECKKLNRLLTSVLASMEYTIRRKEEEERDLTCLLNAFRSRTADHITDGHLTALLNVTVIRNPSRFSYECEGPILAQLQDRNAPFQQFLQNLRDTDQKTYSGLVDYLQHTASVTPEGGAVLDSLFSFAASIPEFSEDSVAAFRRSIPTLVSGSSPPPQTLPTEVPPAQSPSPPPLNDAEAARKEFILNTRKLLTDQLLYLRHRLTMANMACDSLTSSSNLLSSPLSQQPPGGVGAPVSPPTLSSPTTRESAAARHQLITSITHELLGVLDRIIQQCFTAEEKLLLQRPASPMAPP